MDFVYNIFFDIGFNTVLDHGVAIKMHNTHGPDIIFFGPNPDPLYRLAIQNQEEREFSFGFDLSTMTRRELTEKITDTIFNIGFDNVAKKGLDIKMMNKFPGGSKNNVLYIGPNKDII